MTHAIASTPVKVLATKTADAASTKTESAQSAGKGMARPGKSATALLQKAPKSSESDSSYSSESGKQVKQVKEKQLCST